ncbi:hypothetical protein AAFF_G00392180 [Aldrovandia affinis]|uniref:Uncharacterized protein n=1 Tax=Aldrovandia affinis TaxID=143900 RepID=A0AAD7SE73_9TELE|nr:hypothetical protein AAFF_G00392180 [Aldrovandia affinis]
MDPPHDLRSNWQGGGRGCSHEAAPSGRREKPEKQKSTNWKQQDCKALETSPEAVTARGRAQLLENMKCLHNSEQIPVLWRATNPPITHTAGGYICCAFSIAVVLTW